MKQVVFQIMRGEEKFAQQTLRRVIPY